MRRYIACMAMLCCVFAASAQLMGDSVGIYFTQGSALVLNAPQSNASVDTLLFHIQPMDEDWKTLGSLVDESVEFPVAGKAETHAPAVRNPRYYALKTNGLYYLALVPNIGVEYYVGKQWSVAGNWMYAWWSNEGKNNFWRIYGGDVESRYWFGRKAKEKPLQGHHVGVYAQLLTYDIERGGRGYLADKWSYGIGISYGYSMPLSRKLNLDFTLGVGYLTGKYKEYLSIEGHYVWQSTNKLNWWGPTKAEVSLVWLLGRGNENVLKGGRR